MKSLLLAASLLVTSWAPCLGQDNYAYVPPAELEDGWRTGHLQDADVDTVLIYKFCTQLDTQKHQLHSMLLVQDGQILLEEYYGGYTADRPHDLRSTLKSVKSILLGIALDLGLIDDVNDPISKYLSNPVPQKNLDERKEEITIRHLITMSAGWDCDDWDKKSKGQEDKVYKKKDWLQYTVDLPMVHGPGEVSHYCSMGVILMAEIVSRAAGMTLQEFAQRHLFEPLGISHVQWGDEEDEVAIASGKSLYMLPRDLAKIGQLIMNKGAWEGQQIVSEEWIEVSTTPKTTITGLDYCYLWWNMPFEVNGQEVVAKLATGNGGQYIMVFPELDVIAVFTGGAYNSQEDKLPFAIVKHVLLPSLSGLR